jgi:kynurenine formamidase
MTATTNPAHELAQALQRYEVVDLSVVLGEEMPTWPGHTPFAHKIHSWYEPVAGPGQPLRSLGPYMTCWYMVDEHCGTHFDAPPHFIPPPGSGLPHAGELGAVTGDLVPLQRLQGPAAVIDVRTLNASAPDGRSPRITPELVADWERDHGSLIPGEVVIFRTGWDAYWASGPEGEKYCSRPVAHGDFPGWPAPSAATIDHLFERGIRLVATDAPSIGAADEGASMHYAGLERDVLYVECLTGLERLDHRGAYFIFMPLKLAASSGGNGRALAFVPRPVSS